MSLLELLKRQPTNLPRWVGTWARIWVKPSVFSAQSYIVGIAVMDSTGLCDFRFITDTDKFECIYGDSGRQQIDQLIAQARQRFGYAREHHEQITTAMLPPGFVLDPVGHAAGTSASEALESVLNEAEVPMEPRPELARAPRFRTRSAEEVTQAVIDAIKSKLGLRANEILREDRFGDESHSAAVNLVQPDAAGVIASGWYARPERVQLELLRAVTTVETYMADHGKHGQAAVFFLRPTEQTGLRREQAAAIEDALGEVDWQLGRKGLYVAVGDQESQLADYVADWVNG